MAQRCLLAILPLLFLFPPPSYAAAIAGDRAEGSSSYEFAESLFLEGDYYRAITEYKRFLFHHPNHPQVERACLRIAESLLRGKRWKEAVDSVEAFLLRFSRSGFRIDALFLKASAERESKSSDQALKTLEEIIRTAPPPARDRALYEAAMICLDQGKWSRASAAADALSATGRFAEAAPILRGGLEEIDRLPQKSPALAGTLAAVLPGSGHLYTERPKDALVAFLLNASFALAAVQLYRNENYAAAGIFLFFEIGWYGGNIYSAVGSAHKFNRRTKEDFVLDLRRRSDSAIKTVP
jgi:tetratricopeptide (TPR) repeat protein